MLFEFGIWSGGHARLDHHLLTQLRYFYRLEYSGKFTQKIQNACQERTPRAVVPQSVDSSTYKHQYVHGEAARDTRAR